MRRILMGMIVIGAAITSPAMAQTQRAATGTALRAAANLTEASKPEQPKTQPKSLQPAAPEPEKKEAKPERAEAESSTMEREIGQLRQLVLEQSRELESQRAALREQQNRMEMLEHQVGNGSAEASTGSTPRLESKAKSMEAAQQDLSQKIDKLGTDVGDTKKSVDAIKKSNPFTFGGDIRFRVEPFYGGPTSTTAGQPVNALEQVRMRVRLRVNINAKLTDELSGGLTFASGDVNDPISTNQTLSSYYSRKPLLFDRFFINYNPKWFKPFTLTVGKFAYPWYRTELTWDNDLNPEGAAQTFAFNLKTPILKKITLVTFELPFNNVAGNATNGGSGANARLINSSFVYGAQLGTIWEFTSSWKVGAYAAYYDFHRADGVAVALNAANTSQQFANIFRLGGASVQNIMGSVPVGAVTTTLPGGVPTFSTTFTPGGPFQFASKFGLMDVILRNDFKTGFDRFPAVLLFDFVQNTRACENLRLFPAAAVLTNGAPSYSVIVPAGGVLTPPTSVACRANQRHGYWIEARLGRTQEKGDWNFGYTFMRIEREAVMSAFNFSDLRQNSNVLNHRTEIFYQAHKNVQLAFTGLFGRPLATTERFLKRLQLDIVYKF